MRCAAARALVLSWSALAALLVGACGDEGAEQSVPLPPSNAADVRFLQGMLKEDLRLERTAAAAGATVLDAETASFLSAVRADREANVIHLRNLLRFIGSPTGSDTSKSAAQGEGAAAAAASGPAALEAVISSHDRFVILADEVRRQGVFPDAKALADRLAGPRGAEAETARRILAAVPPEP